MMYSPTVCVMQQFSQCYGILKNYEEIRQGISPPMLTVVMRHNLQSLRMFWHFSTDYFKNHVKNLRESG